MAISAVTNKQLGYTLWIHFQDKFTSLVNNDVRDFASLEAVVDSAGAAARSVRYAVEPARPVSNAQMRDPGADGAAFINGEADTIVEKEALAKQLDVVGEFDYDVYKRAEKSPSEIYTGPMGMTLDRIAVNAKESLLTQYYGDGSGAQASVATIAGTTGTLDITLRNSSSYAGCPYWLRNRQKVVLASTAGVYHVPAVASGTPVYAVVSNMNYATKACSLTWYNSSDVALVVNGAGSPACAADDVIYNYSDQSNGFAAAHINRGSVADWGGLLYMPGLQSLGANDGRTVNGTVLSGSYAGTVVDKSSANLFFTDFASLFDLIDRNVGEGKFEYPQLKCSYDTWTYTTNLDEGSKLLRPVVEQSPNGRGEKKYMYDHGDYSAALVARRFVPDFEIIAEPKLADVQGMEGVTKEGPLMFKFTGFEYIMEPGSSEMFRFKISGGSRIKTVQAHLGTYGTFVCTQSAAIGRITGFVIS
jgi:hypothetical protein